MSVAKIPHVSFCDFFEDKQQLRGQMVSVKVRVAAYKHGTGIWDPACKDKGADLKWSDESKTKPGTLQLKDLLRKSGLGDHPVIATLTGKWLGKQNTGVGFLPQPRYVFLMVDAADLDRTKDVERP